MSPPRQILPEKIYLVTRVCAHHRFFLRPSASTNQIFLYLLAVAAKRTGIRVHAYCVMSNHFHMVITDPGTHLPAFHQYLDGLLARALNAALGRREAFWKPGSYNAVELVDSAAVLEKTAYALANPVAAGLVKHGRQWPGLWSAPETIGGPALEASRPVGFFDPDGSMPASALLKLSAPAGFASAAEFSALVAGAVSQREEEAHRLVQGFLGVKKVLATRPTSGPTKEPPFRQLRPRVATKDEGLRRMVLRRLSEFLQQYREAWAARREGRADQVFPAGTYLLRVLHGVACAPAG